jgi:hypothetical protein
VGCDAATWEGATRYHQALAKAQVHPSADGKGSVLTSRVQCFVRMMLRTNGDAELRMIDAVTGLQFSNPGYNFSNGTGTSVSRGDVGGRTFGRGGRRRLGGDGEAEIEMRGGAGSGWR